MLSQFHLSLDKGVRASKNRYISSADVVKNIKSILSSIGKVGIARRGGNSKQIKFLSMARVDYGEGVVETGVAVQPNRNFMLGLHRYEE